MRLPVAVLAPSVLAFSLAAVAAAHAANAVPVGDKARSPAAQAAFHKCMSAALKTHAQPVPGNVHRQIAMKCDAEAGK